MEEYIKNEIKKVLDKQVNFDKITQDKKHIYYIMYSYFYPSKIESGGSKLSINNFCDYFGVYKLTDRQIKNLFFTVYNKIVLKGLKPDLSNQSDKYLEDLFKIADEVYFDNLISRHLNKTKSNLTFVSGGKLSKIKRKFKRNLSSTTDFFFEGMNEKDVQDLLKILNN